MASTPGTPSRLNAQDAATSTPQPRLTQTHAIAIIVGVVIGAGIFKAPSWVAGNVPNEAWLLGVWLAGGIISLIGALCYAELATAYPNAGGDYHFLTRAYGRRLALLYAWARFSVITTGSIALLAFVFGDYMTQIMPLGTYSSTIYAGLSVLVLTWINLRGLHTSASTQSLLTLAEVGGLVLIIVAALWLASSGGPPAATVVDAAATAAAGAGVGTPAATAQAIGLAMVFVLLTYGGWNEAAYISAELKERVSMVRVLVVSVVFITLLYLLVNWAYWYGLGLKGMASSQAVGADLLKLTFGQTGEIVLAIMVAIAALTSINATMLVGARTTYAMGRDWPQLGRLGHWNDARGIPTLALLLQGGFALVLVLIGLAFGGGFRAMVEYTAPIFWLFFLLTGIALFVLRIREPNAPRPFRVPLYPILPLAFCLTCAYMLWSSLSYVTSQNLGTFNAGWVGVGVLISGGIVLLLLSLRETGSKTA